MSGGREGLPGEPGTPDGVGGKGGKGGKGGSARWKSFLLGLLLAYIAVAVSLVIVIGNRHDVHETQERAAENRLLFKFACTLPLAVAERLDRLVVGALEEATTPERIRTLTEYHRDFERGKDICPPLTREDEAEIARLLTALGGRLPQRE